MTVLTCFKAYDIRGRLGDELNEDIPYRIGDTGLKVIQALAEANQFVPATIPGKLTRQSILAPFIAHLLTYIDAAALKPLKPVVNAGNGAAGHVIDAIECEISKPEPTSQQ